MRTFVKVMTKNCFLLTLLLLFMSVGIFSADCFAQNELDDKMQTVRRVAEDWMQAGIEQYHRGYYRQAERSFLMAKDYEDYLSEEQRQELETRLDQTHKAVVKLNNLLSKISEANNLYKEGELEQAEKLLKEVSGNEYLNKPRQEKVDQLLEKVEQELEQKRKIAEEKANIREKYDKAVELYNNNKYEQAKELFTQIEGNELLETPEGKTPANYLENIEEELAAQAAEQQARQQQREAAEVEKQLLEQEIPDQPDEVNKPADKDESSYIEKVQRRRKIIKGHTKTVINDTVNKADNFLGENKFDKAMEQVESARRVVTRNKEDLGEDLYEKYRKELVRLEEKISDARKQYKDKQQQQQRKEALESQRQQRQQMNEARQNRIDQLMESAQEYRKQQRYKDALGQINTLLTIDPQHQQALIMKDMLEDMISFQEQLEIRKESDKEQVRMLMDTEKAAIPYADELTYPDNWAEIDAKRDAEQGGAFQEPENEQVYQQLSKTVDLSMLRPEMPFSEAINILEESVSPPLTIIPMWVDLEQNAEVYRSTPINMSAISSIPLQTALKLLLESVSTGFAQLDYVVESGIIKIATEGSLDVKLQTRTYDVSLLLGQPAEYYAGTGEGRGGQGGGQRGQSGGTGTGGGEYYSEYFEDETESMSREERQQQTEQRKETLITTIQETISPASWFEAGGEGTITSYENKKLIIRQTREIHQDIKNLLDEMQRTLGEQVGIETRFLVVGENFLEDIGLDFDFRIGKAEQYNTSKWEPFSFNQTSFENTNPEGSGISGSLSNVIASTASGGYGGAMDDLQVRFLLRATQAHQDAKTLSTGNVTVLSGEAAVFRTRETIRFIEPPDVGSTDISYGGGGGTAQQNIETDISEVPVGTTLNVTPTITPDKKHVLLNIFVEKTTFKGFEEQNVQIPNLQGNDAISYTVTNIPQTQISRVRTRVSVPDGATLLLGGQKVTSETETEAGVPVLSKMPVVGRLFSNRSKIKDQKNLLILVKPTIILQEERDKEALTVGNSDY